MTTEIASRRRIGWALALGLIGTISARANDSEPRDLGIMDGFYRYSAALGPQLATGAALSIIPVWMLHTDFPYQKKPYDREEPFADAISLVRLLGWGPDGSHDLVTRNSSGVLQYHWNLLKARIDPYFSRGYTDLTLVMDCVPWCLPAHPNQGFPKPSGYGQAAPPGDYEEWRAFIRELCVQLKTFYGQEAVKHFRFRMGTEMQGKERFTGDLEEYLKYYDYAAAAVNEIIPEANVGPFNQAHLPLLNGDDDLAAGSMTKEQKDAADRAPSLLNIVRHAAFGTNYATGGKGSPIDFIARSFYYFPREEKDGAFINNSPDQRVPEIRETWDEVSKVSPKFAHLSREIHEFGPALSTEGGIYGQDTGARGAAQTFDTLIALKEAGASRIWHWSVLETIDPDKTLLMSGGWLYSILDQMRGGRLYALPVDAPSRGNFHRALLSVGHDRAILVVSEWNADRVKEESEKLSVSIPASVLADPPRRVRMLSLTEHNSVYDVLRRNLATAGLLSAKHLNHRGAPATVAIARNYDMMASDAGQGRAFIQAGWVRYERLMREAEMLQPYSGSIASNGKATTVTFTAANPSVSVLVISTP